MYLLNCDVDFLLATFLFDAPHRVGAERLKLIMLSFGRSNYNGFIEICKKYYFDRLFKKFLVSHIDELIKKLLHKKRICFFPCYRTFQANPTKELSFEQLKAKHRLLVYYLSLFNGYVWVCNRTTGYDDFGYNYYNFHDDHRGEIFSYNVLKRKRIHNLEHYEVVHKGRTPQESTFKLREDVNIKTGVFKERKDLICIKVL